MVSNNSHLVWMDLEMTGLAPDTDRIIEIACLVTDSNLNVIAEGPEIAVFQSESVLSGMDEWNTRHHTASGLVERVRSSRNDEAATETQILDFIKEYTGKQTAPLCGNSIWQDRRFLARYMPTLEGWMHYRNIDVSSIKELVRRWYPSLPGFTKQKTHTAMSDIRESIGELKYYQSHVFVAAK